MIFLQILIAILAGVSAGIITGLIPGIHVNLISIVLISISGYLLGFTSPLILAVFVIAMSITHTFLDSIPSVFLGAPDADMALAVLPGHRLLMEGKGYEAVKLTVIGSLLSLIACVVLIPLMIPLAPLIYKLLQPYIGYILIAIVLYMILIEKKIKKIFGSFIVFSLSGILGMIVLTMPNLKQPLFPLLSGLFGVSVLLISLNQKVLLPEQKITETISISKKNKFKAISAAVFSGSLTGLFPGLGAAQAAVIAMQFVGNIGMYAFMVLIGGINTVNFLFSLVTFYTLQKARNGAIVAVMEIIKSISLTELIVLVAAALITGSIATYLALNLSKIFSRMINKVNYNMLIIGVISLIVLLVIILSSWTGLLILITSTSIGIIAPSLGVKRTHSMGCLLLPVILFFVL